MIGAVLVNYAKTWLTGALPEVWLFALGALFVLVTLFLPKGVVGLCDAAPQAAARAAQGERPRHEGAAHDAARSTSALLYLDDVTVSFDGFKALNDLSLLRRAGRAARIIGPNGAGKTTMMDVITGKTRPDEGEVVFDGTVDLTKLDEAEIATPASAASSRSRRCSRTTRCFENLELALAGDAAVWHDCCSPRLTHGRARPASTRCCAIIGLADAAATCWPARLATARSSGSRSACC